MQRTDFLDTGPLQSPDDDSDDHDDDDDVAMALSAPTFPEARARHHPGHRLSVLLSTCSIPG